MTELIWEGNYDERGNLNPVDRTILPFQVVETINESRNLRDRERAQRDLFTKQAHDSEWRNMLIRGDNIEIVAQASPPPSSSRGEGKSAGETPALQARGETAGETPASSSRDKGENAGETPALQRAALLSGRHERGYLPHLKAEGGTYFVTFRLADTLPHNVLESFCLERDDIVNRAQAMGRELTHAEEKRLAELYSDRVESYLDVGHGKCWLREPEIAGLVADALRHFDGQRYDLHAWVVMPNHVHAVLTPREGHTLTSISILHNWKSFTAHEAQKVAQASRHEVQKVAQASPPASYVGVPKASRYRAQKVAQASRLQIPKRDAFWQRESYDHLVRDEADFARVCRYTVENPVKAGLCDKPEDWPYVGVPQTSPPASSSVGVAQASPPASSGTHKAIKAGEDACATSDFRKRCPND